VVGGYGTTVSTVWYRFRTELRERWRVWLALGLILGMAGGAVLALTAGARRTDTAYHRLARTNEAYDVLVSLNEAGFGTPLSESFKATEVERLPHVADTARAGSFFASIGAGVGVLIPPDGRIGTELNRFKMLEGRRPDPHDPTEVVVGFAVAEENHLHVGSKITVLDTNALGDPPPGLSPAQRAYALAARARVQAALPDNALTVVGIEASPGEFPPQIEGTGRYLIHASPALYPVRNDLGLIMGGGDRLLVRLDNPRHTDAFLTELEQLEHPDPDADATGAGGGGGGGGGGVGTVTLALQRDLASGVDRSFHTQAVALRLLALLTAVAAALIAWQLLARLAFLESTEHAVLAALGMDRRERFALGVARAVVIGAVAALVAVGLAVAASPLLPTSLARKAEPEPGVDVNVVVLAVGALAIVLVVVLLAAVPAWRATRSAAVAGAGAGSGDNGAAGAAPARPSVVARLLAQSGVPLSVGTGVRMALEPGRGRSSVPVRSSLAGVTLGIVTLVAAITFGASLAHLLATPPLYGQTWDVGLTTYDDALPNRGLKVLQHDDRVDGLAGVVATSFAVDGTRVDGLVTDATPGDISPAILVGHRPRSDGEIALGTRTLRSLGLGIGDDVRVAPFASGRAPVTLRIVGRAVFPVFGEAGQLGSGLFLTSGGWERVQGQPVDPAHIRVLVRLAPGADVDAVVADLEAHVGEQVFVIAQGKPTDIVNFGQVEATPYLLGAIMAAISAATLTHLLVSAVRRRRRELAILKTLGFVRGQVRSTVAWQATTLAAVALLVGIPLGIAAGRWAWALFADGLGVVAAPRVPALALALTAVVALATANLVAAAPAHFAARTNPAQALRTE
jgi:ABC-type lipoprotein release transport system permease subunit